MALRLNGILVPLVALLIGLALSLVLVSVLGENPLHVLEVMYEGAFGSPTDFGYTLYYSTPLLFTGLSVSWAFRAGLFNIGGEGQMAMGGVALAATGILFPDLSRGPAWLLAFTLAFLVGGMWGAIAGWIKAKRGCHEVLITILLNFIAYGLAGFFILSVFKNPNSQVPETAPVGAGYAVPALPEFLSGGSPANWSIALGILALIVYALVMSRTRFGRNQRLVGSAPELARRSGVDLPRQIILSMFISGGIAGLAAVSPVLGFALKTREGFTGGMALLVWPWRSSRVIRR